MSYSIQGLGFKTFGEAGRSACDSSHYFGQSRLSPCDSAHDPGTDSASKAPGSYTLSPQQIVDRGQANLVLRRDPEKGQRSPGELLWGGAHAGRALSPGSRPVDPQLGLQNLSL